VAETVQQRIAPVRIARGRSPEFGWLAQYGPLYWDRNRMRRALTFLLISAITAQTAVAAQRSTWNKIRYVGGSENVKAERYDWNTTVTMTKQPPLISIDVAPPTVFASGLKLRLTPEMIVSISDGAAAWRRVSETPGCRVPPKTPSLFGLLNHATYLGIVYETAPGKRSAILLESVATPEILEALHILTGKTIEEAP
jgi:hypothetical protein